MSSANVPHSPPPGAIPSGAGASPDSPDLQAMMNQASPTSKTPRPIGTPLQEAKYLGEDMVLGMLQLLPDIFQEMLHIKPTDTPEEIAKKKQLIQNLNQMDDEQRQIVAKEFREKQEKQKEEEEEKVRKQQELQAKEQNELPVPKGKTHGIMPGMPGQSKKQSFMDDFNQKRKQLSSAG